ncbi:hypothetical protein E3N88_34966 [Mikania micrantha]|uniref:Uncharacterized protein n=1 Tax=Mikania micrantha TaxID=192012 RepID=A0A5N6M0I5_9ASTR|nr:hypothetical protein E3N88_34966 [Mikania micrantha]
MASSSTKSRLTSEIMKQYYKDPLYMDVLKQNFQSLEDGIKERDELSKQLQKLTPNAVRDLVILFMVDQGNGERQQINLGQDQQQN